eukprot:gnl/TRDRNA2_/TRDRNA2_42882_c0_seq1.p1 gnl/TRDRNA2_/TRDRNA2_42882_c0~~gnl/TRDRNA2_/TRDRNA2_42882_c0_seq1.p1  ORF type:complete len:564 (+),score=68.43 gnl/TRDRNA2_/TRDRNA2_42882_c0_seq1:273-1964(+)
MVWIENLVRRRDVPGTDTAGAGSVDGKQQHQQLKRCLELKDVIFFGVGKMIGAGILVLIGDAAGRAGPAVVISYMLAAAAVLCSALCYADFVSRVPLAGGAYSFIYASLGEFPAFCTGWVLVFEYACGAGALSRGWTQYLLALLSQLGVGESILRFLRPVAIADDFKLNILAALFVTVLLVIVAVGIRQSSVLNVVVTCIKLGCVLLVVIVASIYADAGNWNHNGEGFAPHGVDGILSAAVLVFYAYIGFDAVATIAEEVRNPSRNVPLGMLLSIAIAVCVYAAVCISVTLMIPASSLDTAAPLATAFEGVGISWMAIVVSVAAVVGIASGTMLNLTSQSRTWMTLARDGLLPSQLARISLTTNTPLAATGVTGFFAILLAALLSFETLVSLMSAGTLCALMCVNMGFIARRHLDQGEALPWLCLALYIASLAAAVWCLSDAAAALIGGNAWTTWPAVAWLLVGGIAAMATIFLAAFIFWCCPPPLHATSATASPGFVLPGGAFAPLLGTVACMFMLHRTAMIHNLWPLLAWVTIGATLYFVYGLQHSALRPESTPLRSNIAT